MTAILKSQYSAILFDKVLRKDYICIQNHTIMLVNTLGTSIKNRRKELGITQPHLAELAGISTNTLYKLERGQSNPSLKILQKLALVLGMELKLVVNLNP